MNQDELSKIRQLHGENYAAVLVILFGYLIFDYKNFNEALKYFSSEESLNDKNHEKL